MTLQKRKKRKKKRNDNMAMFGHGQWYTGELNPNQFATDPRGKMGVMQQRKGLPDSFNGAEMGMEQAQPSNGLLNNPSQQNPLGFIKLPKLNPLGYVVVGGVMLALCVNLFTRSRSL